MNVLSGMLIISNDNHLMLNGTENGKKCILLHLLEAAAEYRLLFTSVVLISVFIVFNFSSCFFLGLDF